MKIEIVKAYVEGVTGDDYKGFCVLVELGSFCVQWTLGWREKR